jgi:hypothetical protein
VHDEHDLDIAAGSFKMVLDVAEHEIDLVGVAQVVGDFLPCGLGGGCLCCPQTEKRSGSGKNRAEHIAPTHGILLRLAARRELRGCGRNTSIN